MIIIYSYFFCGMCYRFIVFLINRVGKLLVLLLLIVSLIVYKFFHAFSFIFSLYLLCFYQLFFSKKVVFMSVILRNVVCTFSNHIHIFYIYVR